MWLMSCLNLFSVHIIPAVLCMRYQTLLVPQAVSFICLSLEFSAVSMWGLSGGAVDPKSLASSEAGTFHRF
jgi:hypothetical protein